MDKNDSPEPTLIRREPSPKAFELPDYEVLEQIGAGGMAKVYRGIHQPLEREVAIKVLLPEFAEDQSFAQRFVREARIAAKLVHPHIVQIYDVENANNQLFLAMEFVKGGDLSQKDLSGTSKTEFLKIVSELCEALDFAHNEGYVHRDIKPQNILFRVDGSLVLSDFGIARSIEANDALTQTGMMVGTPSYMSPEQARAQQISGHSDLYSVAVMLYEIMVGHPPFRGENSMATVMMHVTEPVPELPETLATFQPFFDRALAKNPENRFSNGAELLAALEALLEVHNGVFIRAQTADKQKHQSKTTNADEENDDGHVFPILSSE